MEQLKDRNVRYALPVFTPIHLPEAAGIGKRGKDRKADKKRPGLEGRPPEGAKISNESFHGGAEGRGNLRVAEALTFKRPVFTGMFGTGPWM